jgi:hypothetical protein
MSPKTRIVNTIYDDQDIGNIERDEYVLYVQYTPSKRQCI